jgi:hypothetical protein
MYLSAVVGNIGFDADSSVLVSITVAAGTAVSGRICGCPSV